MKEGGHWPPFYLSLGTSLGPTGGLSLQPSCSENGGFLNNLKASFSPGRSGAKPLRYPLIYQCSGSVHESTHRVCPRFDR